MFAATGAGCLVATAARAGAWARDVGVYAEPTLAPGLRAVGRAFTAEQGAGVAVLTAPAPLLLAQIQHNAAHDLLIVPASFMDQAALLKYVQPRSRRPAGRNRLVVVAAAGTLPPAGADLASLLAEGSIAVTDPTPADTLDGHAVLAALGLKPAHVFGVADTGDAVAMVQSGAARFALVYQTDARANAGLAVVATPDAAPPTDYAVALNPDPPSRNAQAFLDFLATGSSLGMLRRAGLEIAA